MTETTATPERGTRRTAAQTPPIARAGRAGAGSEARATSPPTGPPDAGPRLFGPRIRGRHRRPRPRKALFAVGGLALAAGALSLVRMSPEAGVGRHGTAEAEPRLDPGSGHDRATDTAATDAATVVAVPGVSPSATSVMGGAGATPTTGSTLAPLATTTSSQAAAETAVTSDATTIPEAPNTPAPATTAPRAPAPTSAAPRPAPAPAHSTTPPPPQHPAGPGLCVPIVGLCVGTSPHHT